MHRPYRDLDQADDIVTASLPSFNNNNWLYTRVSYGVKHGYSVLRHLVTFDANVNLTFEAVRALNEDKKRRPDNRNKLWFEERVAGQDEEKWIIKWGGGSGDGTERHAT